MVMQTKHCVCSDADETAGLCGDNMLWTLSRGSGVGSGMCSADCLASVKSWTDLKLESNTLPQALHEHVAAQKAGGNYHAFRHETDSACAYLTHLTRC